VLNTFVLCSINTEYIRKFSVRISTIILFSSEMTIILFDNYFSQYDNIFSQYDNIFSMTIISVSMTIILSSSEISVASTRPRWPVCWTRTVKGYPRAGSYLSTKHLRLWFYFIHFMLFFIFSEIQILFFSFFGF
jgi:hypothetical protein